MAKKKSSNKVLYILLGVVAFIIVFAIIAKSAGWIGKPKTIEVELAEVAKHTIVEKVNASGMVQPETEVKISPDVSGEIIELHVKEGDSVQAGKLLLKIRPDNYESALSRAQALYNQQRANLAATQSRLAQAEAQFQRAEQDFKRNKQLFQEKVISDAEFDQAKATFEVAKEELEAARQNVQAARFTVASAKASVDEARENLGLTSVFAPVNGTVSKLNVEKGERVVGTSQMAGTEMLRIANLNEMEVRVDVNENDIIRVSLGDTAIIDVDAYSHSNKKFKGIVTSIANTANAKVTPEAVTEFQVKIRILNSSYQDLLKEKKKVTPFRPGMTASVEVITNKKENVLSVPLAAVTTRNEQDHPKRVGGEDDADSNPKTTEKEVVKKEEEIKEVVFVDKNGVAEMVEVETGISDFDYIEIKKGLELGQKIVAGPYIVVSKRLEEGDLIEPIKAEKKKGKDGSSSIANN